MYMYIKYMYMYIKYTCKLVSNALFYFYYKRYRLHTCQTVVVLLIFNRVEYQRVRVHHKT